jgi:hypothetical protein
MAWYHWVAGYLIIIASITFTIIPEKPWWLWLCILGVGGLGLLMVFLPHKEDKYAKKQEDL